MLAHIRLWKHLTTAPRAAMPQGISETIRRAGLTKLAERLSDNSSGRPRILAAVRAFGCFLTRAAPRRRIPAKAAAEQQFGQFALTPSIGQTPDLNINIMGGHSTTRGNRVTRAGFIGICSRSRKTKKNTH